MKLRSELHLSRKIYHALGVFVILVLYRNLNGRTFIDVPADQLVVLLAAFFILLIDFLRLRHRRLQKNLKIFERVMRNEEQQRLSSMSFLICGCALVICFFPSPVVHLSLLILAIGDPTSSIFGVLYGKDKILRSKTLQGTMAGFIACTLVSWAYFWTQNIMLERIVLVAILTGIIGALAELIPFGGMDDNFTIPICSATLLSGLFYLFGGYAT